MNEMEKLAEIILPIREGATWVNWNIACQLAQEILEAGYLPVEEYHPEPLTWEELTKIDEKNAQSNFTDALVDTTRATIAKLGKIYRLKEG